MMEAQAVEADEILWSLLRSHQQRAEFTRRMADREKSRDRSELATQLAERAREYEADARVIERIVESRRVQVTDDGAVEAEGNRKEKAK